MMESNYEEYRTHYYYLEYRFGTPQDRLSVLSTWTFQPIAGTPVGSLQVWSSLLDIYINEAAVIAPNVLVYHSIIAEAVEKLSEIYQSARVNWEFVSEEDANLALEVYWNKREVVHNVIASLLQIDSIAEDLKSIVPDYEQMQRTIENSAKALRVAIEILAQPSQPKIPEAIVIWSQRLTQIKHNLVNNNLVADYEAIFVEGCQHPFAPIRRDSVNLLGYFSSKITVNTILTCCVDSDHEVRRHAIMSLCQKQRNDERIVSTLIQALLDIDEEVCASALDCLRRIKSKKALHPLIKCLNREFKNVAYTGWVGSALAKIPDLDALQPLIHKLDEEMKKPNTYHDRNTHPVAGLYSAIRAIGGSDADDALSQYFD